MKERFLVLSIVLIALLVNQRWITNFSILTSGDWYSQNLETLRQFLSLPSIWSMNSALGFINVSVSFYPFNFLSGLLARQGITYGFIERVVFMWPIIIALPVFSYLLIKKNIRNSLAAVIGSFAYSYNTYFSLIKTGHLTLLMSYALAPLVFLFFQKALEKKRIRYALSAGLFGFIVSFYEFRIFYILCFILFIYFIYYVFFVEKIKRLSGIIKISFLAGLPVFVDLLLNLYWLLSLGKTGTLSSNAIFNRSLFGNEFLNINYAITLFHPFWTGSKPAIFIMQDIPVYFWLIPIFAFLGLWLNRKNKNILFFGLIAILGIFLTKQAAHPFLDLYSWLYKYFPGFNAFREASKFYFLIVLGYSVLIAGFVDWLWRNWTNTKFQIFGKYIFIAIIALIFLLNTKPFITGEISTLFVPRETPTDYLVVNNFILKQNDYFRILWIPVTSRWAVYINNHPIVSAVDTINAEWDFFIKNKRNDKVTQAELAIDSLTFSRSSNLLNQSSIKYVIIPLEDKVNDDDFFPDYGKPRQYYINELNKINWLKRINIGTKEIVVYENYNYRPHIYITDNQESINKNQPFTKIDYKFVNPTKYTFSIKNVSNPFYLNFSEAFNSGWNIRVGSFNWFDVLKNSNYFVDSKNHIKNDAGLNSFYLNPEIVCKQHSCIKNKDGSYDISGTLYFAPQSYMYLGLIISGSTLIIIFGYLGFIGFNSLKRKYERKNK